LGCDGAEQDGSQTHCGVLSHFDLGGGVVYQHRGLGNSD